MTLAITTTNTRTYLPTQVVNHTRTYTSIDYNSRGIKKKEEADPLKSKDDIELIKEYFLANNQYRDYCMFVFGINCGLRCGDMIALNMEHVLLPNGDITDELRIIEEKTGKSKLVALNESMKVALHVYLSSLPAEYKQKGQPLFRSRKYSATTKDYRVKRDSFYLILTRACNSLGINAHVGTHTLRKTFGYHHFQTFHNIEMLQRLFNHATSFQTLTYIGMSKSDIAHTAQYLNL